MLGIGLALIALVCVACGVAANGASWEDT